MKNFRSNKGSITLFVLLSCLFFLVLVTSTSIYIKNKSIAQDSQYYQIKEKYANRPINEDKHPDPNTETDTTFSTNYGKIDIIWLDINNKVIAQPNEPILTYGSYSMDAVIYDTSTSNFVKTANTANGSWYSYNGKQDENKWANAITANGSYFVWIPRYAYRITYYDSETSTEPTGYYDGYGQWNASTLELRLKLDTGIETVDFDGEKYIVHPAFCDNRSNNYDNGGWSSNISGFWCAKYEASNGNNNSVEIKQEKDLWVSLSSGEQYEKSITANYGYPISTANSDGQTSFMFSHMMKNSEWGAVAYLSHSKYGRNGNEVLKYNLLKSPNFVNYQDNSSTTGNIYGIYNLSGGAGDRVAVFNSTDKNNNFADNDYASRWTLKTGLTVNSNSTKYATKYFNTTTESQGNDILKKYGKVGDATKEVNTAAYIPKGSILDDKRESWFGDICRIVSSDEPFSYRGQPMNASSSAGIFASEIGSGGPVSNIGFRTILIP